ncbi:hypothetical protein DSL72_001464 [Monilinia vaccinii-corymbosi]|uniref:Uncharacterized protein n=1 Tax=Monilinia vaccinii-corymbosi TaxID=61207 RepID=A0A8A3P1Y0_9HELO|nr:hypothetical protein DSL72_001464 [Monilinia vaccinii-corymbosi]
MGNRVSLPSGPSPQQWEVHYINSWPAPPPRQILHRNQTNSSYSNLTAESLLVVLKSDSMRRRPSADAIFLENLLLGLPEDALIVANRYYEMPIEFGAHKEISAALEGAFNQMRETQARRLEECQREMDRNPDLDPVGTPLIHQQSVFLISSLIFSSYPDKFLVRFSSDYLDSGSCRFKGSYHEETLVSTYL